MQHQPTLETVTEAFLHWRSTRNGLKAKTPEALKQQALDLLNHYRVSQVLDALHINSNTLKSWQKKQAASSSSPQFIALPYPALTEEYDASPLRITWRNAHGTELIIAGQLSPSQLNAVIGSLQNAIGVAP